MAIVSLADNQRRTQFFRKTVLLNLNYWLAEIKEADIATLNNERDNIIKAILLALHLREEAWPVICQLITTFSPYMERGGYWEVWNNVLHQALKLAATVGDEGAQINLSVLLARLLFLQSHFKEARRYYRQTIRLARRAGDAFNEARACTNLGFHFAENGFWQRAEVLCCHALKIFEQIDNDHGRAHTENHLGYLYTCWRRWPEAEAYLKRACMIWQRMGDKHGLMRGYTNLGLLYIDTNRPEKALPNLKKALEYAHLTGEALTMGIIYVDIGLAYRLKKEYVEAETSLWKAETIFRQQANAFGLAKVADNLGLLYLDQRRWQATELHLKAALAAWRNLNSKFNEIQVITHLAEYELIRGNRPQTCLWLDEAEQLLAHYDRAKHYQIHWAKVNDLRRSLSSHQ